jgi:hypothetical protein
MHSRIEDRIKELSMRGDSGQVAEEILAEQVSDVLQRCKVVEMTVEDGDFTLQEALSIYNVSELEYNFFVKSKRLQKADFAKLALLLANIIFDISKNPSMLMKLFSMLPENSKKTYSEVDF